MYQFELAADLRGRPTGRRWFPRPREDRPHTGYAGIDPGFEHNPGVSREEQLRKQWGERDEAFAQHVEPEAGTTPVDDGADLAQAGAQRPAAREALRAIRRVHGDGGPKFRVREENDPGFLGAYRPGSPAYPAVPATGYPGQPARPATIAQSTIGVGDPPHTLGRPERWPAFTMVHEIGQLLDRDSLPGNERYESEQQTTAEMRAVIRAIKDSPTYQLLSADS